MAESISSEASRIAAPPVRPDQTRTKGAQSPAKERRTKPGASVNSAAILAALDGHIEPVRATLTYRVGILLTTLLMVLLPLIYVALIAVVACGIFYHAVNDVSILEYGRGRGKIVVILLYVAPLVTGALLILFMFKPLLSRPTTREQWRTLKRQDQPFLFEFIERLCNAVGSPVPSQIRIDCQVNASASFRRGMTSFVGRDLVLTIGMPLVAGMTLRQLAGVLAHEFGHFAQGSGMRLTYVIRSINHWFARVVYERDAWDEWLVEQSVSNDIRIGWIFWITRGFVWLTRKILWALMMAGNFVAGYMLRQMEFDADRYEARMSGSDEFAKTSRRLTELNLAFQGAMSDLGDYYREGRLADDVLKLIVFNVDQIPPETKAKIAEHVRSTKTGWFDTHPADSERIKSANREQAQGLFRINAPASVLFRNYDGLSRLVTKDLYRLYLGDNVDEKLLQPTENLIKRTEAEQGNYKALGRYFQGTLQPLRVLPLHRWTTERPAKPKEVVEGLQAAREEMLSSAERYRKMFRKYDEADTHILYAIEAEALHSAALRVQPDGFPIDLSTGEKARTTLKNSERRLKILSQKMEPFEIISARRLTDALDLLNVPQVQERLEGGDAVREEADRLLATAKSLAKQMQNVLTLRNDRGALAFLLSRLDGNEVPQPVVNAIKLRMGRVSKLLAEIRGSFESVPFPFEHAKGTMSIATFIYENEPDAENPWQLYDAADTLGQTVFRLYGRVLGRLAEIAEQVERLAGLPPLPELPREPTEQPQSTA